MTLHLDDRVFSLNVKSYILMCINIYTWICARVEHIWHIFIFSNSEATTCFCLILAIYLIREPQRFCVDPFKGSSLNLTYYMWHCPHTIFGYLFWPTRDISVGPLYTRNHSSWTFTSSVHLHIYICCYICTICIRIMIRTIYQLFTKYQHGTAAADLLGSRASGEKIYFLKNLTKITTYIKIKINVKIINFKQLSLLNQDVSIRDKKTNCNGKSWIKLQLSCTI